MDRRITVEVEPVQARHITITLVDNPRRLGSDLLEAACAAHARGYPEVGARLKELAHAFDNC